MREVEVPRSVTSASIATIASSEKAMGGFVSYMVDLVSRKYIGDHKPGRRATELEKS